ncbi:hypothetical protein Hanom_Chr14g01322901 [Helianthus anomalus]
MVVSELVQIAIPQQLRRLHLLNFMKVFMTALKATTAVATKVTTDPLGSPQNQKKGASTSDDMESTHITKADTTTSGGISDDPIKLGDELRYRELTARMSSFENTIGEMKDMMKHLLEASKSHPIHQQITQELWNSVQPILAAQRELAEINHNSHMELIKVMVEARYKDTQANTRGIKESRAKLTGSSPTLIFEKDDEDDAKKGGRKTQRESWIKQNQKVSNNKRQGLPKILLQNLLKNMMLERKRELMRLLIFKQM